MLHPKLLHPRPFIILRCGYCGSARPGLTGNFKPSVWADWKVCTVRGVDHFTLSPPSQVKKREFLAKKTSDPDLAGIGSVLPASSSSFFISPFSLYTHPATAKTLPNVLIFSCCQAHRFFVIPLRISVKCTPVLHIRWRRWWHESSKE